MVTSLVIALITNKTFVYNETDRQLHDISKYAIYVFATCVPLLFWGVVLIDKEDSDKFTHNV